MPESLGLENISLSGGGTAVVFDRITGKTSNSGSFEVVDASRDDHVVFTINAYGQIEIL
ncbi:MAG: hypothetical protein V1908_04130 [Candidatus Peregrinibacteria bacterium]